MTDQIAPQPSGSEPLLEVFADVWCPFAHVGLRVIAETRDELRPGVVMRVRAWPLELVNGRPMDAAATRHHIDDLRAQVAPGLFGHPADDPFPTSSLPALALVESAYTSGAVAGERASFAVRDAMFERGLDISQHHVIADLAAELGVRPPDERDHAAVVESWHDGQRRGVKGSPHVFCGASDSFCPSLDISREGSHLMIAADRSALETFLRDALARLG